MFLLEGYTALTLSILPASPSTLSPPHVSITMDTNDGFLKGTLPVHHEAVWDGQGSFLWGQFYKLYCWKVIGCPDLLTENLWGLLVPDNMWILYNSSSQPVGGDRDGTWCRLCLNFPPSLPSPFVSGPFVLAFSHPSVWRPSSIPRLAGLTHAGLHPCPPTLVIACLFSTVP